MAKEEEYNKYTYNYLLLRLFLLKFFKRDNEFVNFNFLVLFNKTPNFSNEGSSCDTQRRKLLINFRLEIFSRTQLFLNGEARWHICMPSVPGSEDPWFKP